MIRFEREELLRLVQVASARSRDPSRPQLTGVRMDFRKDDNRARVVATDGKMAAFALIKPVEWGDDVPGQVVLSPLAALYLESFAIAPEVEGDYWRWGGEWPRLMVDGEQSRVEDSMGVALYPHVKEPPYPKTIDNILPGDGLVQSTDPFSGFVLQHAWRLLGGHLLGTSQLVKQPCEGKPSWVTRDGILVGMMPAPPSSTREESEGYHARRVAEGVGVWRGEAKPGGGA